MIRIVVDNDTGKGAVLNALREDQLEFLGHVLIQFDHGDHLSSIGGGGVANSVIFHGGNGAGVAVRDGVIYGGGGGSGTTTGH